MTDTREPLVKYELYVDIGQGDNHESFYLASAVDSVLDAVVKALELVATVGDNVLRRKFDHSGAMNATQLGDRDTVVNMLSTVNGLLARLRA